MIYGTMTFETRQPMSEVNYSILHACVEVRYKLLNLSLIASDRPVDRPVSVCLRIRDRPGANTTVKYSEDRMVNIRQQQQTYLGKKFIM